MSTTFPVVIAAAGIGRRMRSEVPKQYLTILGKTVIEHTIMRLCEHPLISDIIVVLHPHDSVFKSLPVANLNKVHTVDGGAERVDSVLAGLQWLQTYLANNTWVLVHDAARPCVTHNDLTQLIKIIGSQSKESAFAGGILATRVRDTMKRGAVSTNTSQQGYERIAATESREHLWHALTPQLFQIEALTKAIFKSMQEGALITDEASAMEHCGYPVALVEGGGENIKITTPDDLKLAEFYLRNQQKE